MGTSTDLRKKKVVQDILSALVTATEKENVADGFDIFKSGNSLALNLDETLAESAGYSEMSFLVIEKTWGDKKIQVSVAQDDEVFERVAEDALENWLEALPGSLSRIVDAYASHHVSPELVGEPETFPEYNINDYEQEDKVEVSLADSHEYSSPEEEENVFSDDEDEPLVVSSLFSEDVVEEDDENESLDDSDGEDSEEGSFEINR